MDKKGQIQGIGALVVLAFAIIVGIALLIGGGGIAANSAQVTTLRNVANQSITLPAAGSSLEIPGFANYQGTPVVINATDSVVVPASNYTFSASVSTSDGQKSLFITSNGGLSAGKGVNISFTGVPDGYSEDSLGRVFPSLIVLFTVLALALLAIGYAVKNGGELLR